MPKEKTETIVEKEADSGEPEQKMCKM